MCYNTPKSSYTWSNCFDCLDSTGDSWGIYKIGGKTSISPTSGYDTARENWGGTWRMPTNAENEELCNKCTWTWTSQGGHKGCDEQMIKDLNNHFMGECTEVGMYLAMSRQADREGYPEVAEAFKRYAWEEAEHASKFAELLGDCVWDTKTNLEKRMNAEAGA